MMEQTLVSVTMLSSGNEQDICYRENVHSIDEDMLGSSF